MDPRNCEGQKGVIPISLLLDQTSTKPTPPQPELLTAPQFVFKMPPTQTPPLFSSSTIPTAFIFQQQQQQQFRRPIINIQEPPQIIQPPQPPKIVVISQKRQQLQDDPDVSQRRAMIIEFLKKKNDAKRQRRQILLRQLEEMNFIAELPIIKSEMAEKDAQALKRIEEMKRQGIWSGGGNANAAFKAQKEPPKTSNKTHWDYLLDEMEFMAKDFKAERQRKMAAAKKAARICAKAVKTKERNIEQAIRNEENELRKRAALIARCIKGFWSQIGKIVAYKLQRKLDSERSEAMTKHLDFVVGQTEKLSKLIANDLASTSATAKTPQKPPSRISIQESEEEEYDDEQQQEDEQQKQNEEQNALSSREKVEKAAEEATAAQPTGTTLATTKVKTKVPFLIHGTLREYQHVGLDWLAAMYEKKLNVILADEMGLGKTIMTVALLAHLACEKGIWGPHLIVVPSSTVMNWELELKKWCPALKVVTYVGSVKERAQKRSGWSKDNAMHVCITSYQLALQDVSKFRRQKWCYMILDEAQNIKNFRSQRWQVLLQFHSERRLLLTGTPLQNSVLELWSLMHFLMPAVFASHAEFSEWFSVPLTAMVERGGPVDTELVGRLHSLLRPFLLRRVKKDVEHNLPPKSEVIVRCRLSRRQQFLYEEFINASNTQTTLASGSFFGVANVLMQLRKVCNHPDLFTPRPTEAPFDVLEPIKTTIPSYLLVTKTYEALPSLSLLELETKNWASASRFSELANIASKIILNRVATERNEWNNKNNKNSNSSNIIIMIKRTNEAESTFMDNFAREKARIEREERWNAMNHVANLNKERTLWCIPLFGGASFRESITIETNETSIRKSEILSLMDISKMVENWSELAIHFVCLHERARASSPQLILTHASTTQLKEIEEQKKGAKEIVLPLIFALEPISIRLCMHFPDKRLLQYDCGKLQELEILLRKLHDGGHKAVLFTQMTTMLDIIEDFANIHRYRYLRLDGSTKIERRQIIIERFNRDPRVFLFLSTPRSGGFGINLTGADTVIFYDSDWNPAVDAQAQDRCHRIGQTRPVTIYRLVTELTVEENILKKASQKKALNRIVIKEGSFTTNFLSGLGLEDLIKPELRGETTKNALAKRSSTSENDETTTADFQKQQTSVNINNSNPNLKMEEKEMEEALEQVEIEPSESAAAKAEEKAMEDEFAEEQQQQRTSHSVSPQSMITPNTSTTPNITPTPTPTRRTSTVVKSIGEIAAEDEMIAEAVAAGDSEQIHTLESELNPLQKYGIRFLETTDTTVSEQSQIESLRAELEAKFGSREKDMTTNVPIIETLQEPMKIEDEEIKNDSEEEEEEEKKPKKKSKQRGKRKRNEEEVEEEEAVEEKSNTEESEEEKKETKKRKRRRN